MKKLFHTGSLVEIEGIGSLRISGPYTLLALTSNLATVQTSHYMIEVIAEDLTVDALSEEVAVLTFTSMTRMTATMLESKETPYGP